MPTSEQKVYIVDDDIAVLDALGMLMKSVGLESEVFQSAQNFLDNFVAGSSGCLLLDVRMPNMSGLQLQEILNEKNIIIPIIFITGHADIPIAVQAMKKGALEFIEKPFNHEELIDCIHRALKLSSANIHKLKQQQLIGDRIKQLTPRELEVMEKIVLGEHNKTIALDLGISQRTIEIHRAKVMQKMRALSLAHLVRMSLLAQEENS